MQTIYSAGVNPARALYDLWYVLVLMRASARSSLQAPPGYQPVTHYWAMRQQTMSHPCAGFGVPGWGVGIGGFDRDGKPVFAFGRHFNYYGIDTKLLLAADGRFLLYQLWGGQQRGGIENSTFLKYNYVASRVQWYVQTEPGAAALRLHDHENPVPYISSKTLTGAWMRLEGGDHGWQIAVADQHFPGETPNEYHDHARRALQERYDNDVRLRERRYRLQEKHFLRDKGLSARALTVTNNGKRIDREAAIKLVAANLDVSRPAKTVPMNRTRPEGGPHGKHNLVTATDH